MQLASKLQELESQLVRGGRNILDTYTERQMELERKLSEIAERKKREVEMQQQLELQEETTLEIRETVTSLQQEVDVKTRKLKKCYAKWVALKQELVDTREEHNRDRRELEMTQNELIKELKRLLLIIDNFVPAEVKSRLTTQARYDEEQEEWNLCPVIGMDGQQLRRPVAQATRRRPVSEFALQQIRRGGGGGGGSGDSLRYRGENILSHELDMPLRTTFEYRNPKVSASLQAVLAEAMQTEGDLDISTDQSNYTSQVKSRLDKIINRNVNNPDPVASQPSAASRARSSRPETAAGTRSLSAKRSTSAYPKARGLIPK